MDLHVIRLMDNNVQTLSQAIIMANMEQVMEFNFIERPWLNNQVNISCIPPGDYTVVKRPAGYYGSRFNYTHFEVLNVPGRTYIKIHIANYVTDLQGCLGPGSSATFDLNGDGQIDVSSSTATLRKMVNILPQTFKMRIYPYRPL